MTYLCHKCTPCKLHLDSSDDSTLAGRFHTFFTTKVTDIHRTIDSNTEQYVVEQRQSSAGVHAQFVDLTPASRKDITHIVRTATAETWDLDPKPTDMVKNNINLLASLLTGIVNASLQAAIVPMNMKHALVAPNSKTYCPISQVSIVSKILELYVATE